MGPMLGRAASPYLDRHLEDGLVEFAHQGVDPIPATGLKSGYNFKLPF